MGLKVNWLSYLDPQVYTGGGERICRELIAEALHRGHEVKISSARWGKLSRLVGPRVRLHKAPDVWILTDIWKRHITTLFSVWTTLTVK